ncbi:APC family permease [Umezawaea sp. Da 62-37]|uniref:APC family permease n=1 Tax=Umezawaea sp. Da 62-37 TaxID=3075927 RepID=UPI0028F71A69|nr:APC family permease [Umezawaea sp. Da 62-37]WNV83076.1 APC family permease [Umezawaea sp. Da 62-37]
MGQILAIVATAATPMTVCVGVVATSIIVTGEIGLPAGFLAVPVLLSLFFVGQTSMASRVPGPGMLYSYVSAGAGRPLGAGAAAVSLLAYNLLQVGLYGLIGGAAEPLLAEVFGAVPPWWVSALALCALVAVLGPRKLKVLAAVLQILLVLEVGTLAVYGAANLTHAVNGTVPWHALNPVLLFGPGAAVLLLMSLLGSIGIESGAAYISKARDGHRTVWWAMMIATVGAAVIYVLFTVGVIAAVGADAVVDTARAQNVGMVFELARLHLGETAVPIGQLLLCTSIAAAALSLHATCNAHAYALACEGLLPRALSRVNPRTDQPSTASAAQCVLGLAAIVVFAVAGWPPQDALFYGGGTAGALAVLLVLTLTAIAIAFYFWREHHRIVVQRRNAPLDHGEAAPDDRTTPFLRTRLVPSISAVLLAAVLVLIVIKFDTLLGPTAEPVHQWGIFGVVAVALAAGIARALYLRRHHYEIYLRLGRGPAASPSATRQAASQ